MTIEVNFYGTVIEGNDYFSNRLHERAWFGSAVQERPKALWAATQIIDTLNFKGFKSTVWTLLQNNGLTDYPVNVAMPTEAQLREANLAQALEFPRGTDTEVPQDILIACYELAHSLLDGKDPEMELENLGVVSQGYSSVRTSYNRSQVPIEHLINGVPNMYAWRLLRPFLRDGDAIKLSRVS
ncbi:MAG: hypothetical protein KDA84_12380 [Planctomycetaceae bacterium]|nr:hypothetical protein [Planctomycetaceae bacterium]